MVENENRNKRILYTDHEVSVKDDVITLEINPDSNESYKCVLATREKHIRQALIFLGWTPPPESKDS